MLPRARPLRTDLDFTSDRLPCWLPAGVPPPSPLPLLADRFMLPLALRRGTVGFRVCRTALMLHMRNGGVHWHGASAVSPVDRWCLTVTQPLRICRRAG